MCDINCDIHSDSVLFGGIDFQSADFEIVHFEDICFEEVVNA